MQLFAVFGVADSTQPKPAWFVNLSSDLFHYNRLKVENVNMPGLLNHASRCCYMMTLTYGLCIHLVQLL